MSWPEEDKDNKTQEIIDEILHIQSLKWNGWFSAFGRKLRVDTLHTKLDKMGYGGDRPPRSWNQYSVGKNLEN